MTNEKQKELPDPEQGKLPEIIAYEKFQSIMNEAETLILKGNPDAALGAIARARLQMSKVVRKLFSVDERPA